MNNIKVATLGDSDSLKAGNSCIAIGNALGYGQSGTVGYISALTVSYTHLDVYKRQMCRLRKKNAKAGHIKMIRGSQRLADFCARRALMSFLSGAGIAACMERGHLLTYGCAPASDLAYLRCFPYRLPLRSGR